MTPPNTDLLRDALFRLRQLQADVELFPNGDVKQINFVGTAVDDEFLPTVALFSRLERLYLGATRVTDEGMRHLEGLPNLQYLSLHGTDVTPQCMSRLRAKLPNCQVCPRGDSASPSAPTPPSQPTTRIEISIPPKPAPAEPVKTSRDNLQQEVLLRFQALELQITALRRFIEDSISQ